MKPLLLQRIRSREARIGIVGLGYVGLPLTRLFCQQNFTVTGLDVDDSKIEALKIGHTYIRHVEAKPFQDWYRQGRFEPSTDFSKAAQTDVIILCVPTPLDEHREPDLSYVLDSVDALLPNLRPGQLLILESTTGPGRALHSH